TLIHIENTTVTSTTSLVDRTYFFFQAEDGIRDLYVTGVQTCALPISAESGPRRRRQSRQAELPGGRQRARHRPLAETHRAVPGRSEEHTSELQSRRELVCRLLLEKKKPTQSCPMQ